MRKEIKIPLFEDNCKICVNRLRELTYSHEVGSYAPCFCGELSPVYQNGKLQEKGERHGIITKYGYCNKFLKLKNLPKPYKYRSLSGIAKAEKMNKAIIRLQEKEERKRDKAFWDMVEANKREVAKWPAWKQNISITAHAAETGEFIK